MSSIKCEIQGAILSISDLKYFFAQCMSQTSSQVGMFKTIASLPCLPLQKDPGCPSVQKSKPCASDKKDNYCGRTTMRRFCNFIIKSNHCVRSVMEMSLSCCHFCNDKVQTKMEGWPLMRSCFFLA